MRLLFLIVAILILLPEVDCKKKRHHYEVEEKVPFEVNKIGPYANPSETYEYYSLPFCQPLTIEHKHSSLGEDFTGDHKQNA